MIGNNLVQVIMQDRNDAVSLQDDQYIKQCLPIR